MEQWEYLTELLYANLESQGVKEFMQKSFPDWKKPPKYTPETLIPRLDRLGRQGWELVHMQPIAVVDDDLILHPGEYGQKSCVYFAVFNRRLTTTSA